MTEEVWEWPHAWKTSIDDNKPKFPSRKYHVADPAWVQTSAFRTAVWKPPWLLRQEKDFGLKPDTNKHISGFRILLPLRGSWGCRHNSTRSLIYEPASAAFGMAGASSRCCAASSQPERRRPGTAPPPSPGGAAIGMESWQEVQCCVLTAVLGWLRVAQAETLRLMGSREQSLFTEVQEVMTPKYSKGSSRKQL